MMPLRENPLGNWKLIKASSSLVLTAACENPLGNWKLTDSSLLLLHLISENPLGNWKSPPNLTANMYIPWESVKELKVQMYT